MRSATRPVLTRISSAGTRPPSTVGTSRWHTIPRSVPASVSRTCFCWCGGKKSITRLTVSVASCVCSVDSTRCPVSAACSAARTVSVSRISPIRITSGSCRSAARSADRKSVVSWPISRWLIEATSSLCSTSMGSSIVTMCTGLVRVEVADHRGERRGLARARRPGHQDQASLLVGQRLDRVGQPDLLERRPAEAQLPQHHRDRAPLAEHVRAEPTHVGDGVGEVDLAPLLEDEPCDPPG